MTFSELGRKAGEISREMTQPDKMDRQTTIKLPEDLRSEIETVAAKEDRNLSQMIRQLLREALEARAVQ